MNTNKSITNKEALEAFQVLKGNDNITIAELIKKLNAFQEYLVNLCSKICKKGLKNGFIYQWIFTTGAIKQRDFECYCKANLFAAAESLNRIISKIEKDGINDVRRRMLLDFICDLKLFIKKFDDNQDYTWLVLNTNSHITNFYSDLSNNIFWNGMPGNNSEERLVLATSTPFVIRQSIEYKIKRILGIDYILINGKLDFGTMKKCFKAVENNISFYNTKNFDFKTIKLIYTWTHYYIHGGYRPEPWRTETTIFYLKNLFYSGQTSKENSYTLYAGVVVNEADLEKLKKGTEETIKNEADGEVRINWLSHPEVAIIKTTLKY